MYIWETISSLKFFSATSGAWLSYRSQVCVEIVIWGGVCFCGNEETACQVIVQLLGPCGA